MGDSEYSNEAVEALFSHKPFKVTGGMIKSIIICERQAWFHQQNISVVTDHEYIKLGNLVEDSYYESSETDNQIIDGMISPDKVESQTIYETKKSSGALEAIKAQLKYYIWYLNKTRDSTFTGVLQIPKERKTISIDAVDDSEIVPKIEKLYHLYNKGEIPEFEKVKWCKNCAYKDICWMGQGDINE